MAQFSPSTVMGGKAWKKDIPDYFSTREKRLVNLYRRLLS